VKVMKATAAQAAVASLTAVRVVCPTQS